MKGIFWEMTFLHHPFFGGLSGATSQIQGPFFTRFLTKKHHHFVSRGRCVTYIVWWSKIVKHGKWSLSIITSWLKTHQSQQIYSYINTLQSVQTDGQLERNSSTCIAGHRCEGNSPIIYILVITKIKRNNLRQTCNKNLGIWLILYFLWYLCGCFRK